MVQTAILYVVLQTLHAVSSLAETPYIARIIDRRLRHCVPTYDCPPGHEILPCTVEFTREKCQKCPEGFVQPDFTSSSTNQDAFKCFQPKGECGARDVKDSRTPNTENCRFNRYCKCNTDTCYYGDPCTCQKRHTPCRVGETMNELGDCVPCPDGTEKKEKGCGPCKRILNTSTITRNVSSTKVSPTIEVTEQTSTIPTSTSDFIRLKADRPTSMTIESKEIISRPPDTTENEVIITSQPLSDHVKQSVVKDDSYTSLMTGIWVLTSLVVLIITTFVVGLLLCRRRTKLKKVCTDAEHHLNEHGQLLQLLPTQTQRVLVNEQEENKNNLRLMRQNGIIPSVSLSDSCSGISNSSDTGSVNSSNDDPVLASTLKSHNIEENKELNESLISQEEHEDPTLSLQMDISKVIFEDRVVPSSEPNDDGNKQKYYDIQSENSQENISQCCGKIEQGHKDVVYVKSSKLDDLTSSNSHENSSTVTAYTQVTDVCSSPVVQETYSDIANNNKEHQREATEHSIKDSIPHHSPLSDAAAEQQHQEYGHLVSASDRSTNTMISGLEYHNFDMVGTKTLSVCSHDTDNKQLITEIDINVENDNDRQN